MAPQTVPTRPSNPTANPPANPPNAPTNPLAALTPEAVAAMTPEQRAALMTLLGINPSVPTFKPFPVAEFAVKSVDLMHVGAADSNVWFGKVGNIAVIAVDLEYGATLLGQPVAARDGDDGDRVRKSFGSCGFTSVGDYRISCWIGKNQPKQAKQTK
jgi:hypothetical protein